MGKVRTSLRILVIGPVHPEITALADRGHQVDAEPSAGGEGLLRYDLILGPNCARYLPGMEPFLPQFLKGAAKVKGRAPQ